MNNQTQQQTLKAAAKAIQNAKALVVTAGAGMGVDSGLPDYRGADGFWRAYPPLKARGLTFSDMCTPEWLERDPEFAWWFFSHQIELYRRTQPHAGFGIMRKWAERMPNGYFVFTSNVDGHFQKAGFDAARVVECHGSIFNMQCTDPQVSREVWEVLSDFHLEVDVNTLRAKPPLPVGPPSFEESKRTFARPNILMFKDWNWIADRTTDQYGRYLRFLNQLNEHKDPFVVIEIGAGKGVPTVRKESEHLCQVRGTLIRINPTDYDIPPYLLERDRKRFLSIPLGTIDALNRLLTLLEGPAAAGAKPESLAQVERDTRETRDSHSSGPTATTPIEIIPGSGHTCLK